MEGQFGILLEGGLGLFALGRRHQGGTVKAGFRTTFRQDRFIVDRTVLFPEAFQDQCRQQQGIAAGKTGGSDQISRQGCLCRKIFRLDDDGKIEALLPAGKLDQPVGPALWCPLRQGQTAGLGKDLPEIDRIDIHLGAGLFGHRHEPPGSEITPRAGGGHKVVYSHGHDPASSLRCLFWLSGTSILLRIIGDRDQDGSRIAASNLVIKPHPRPP